MIWNKITLWIQVSFLRFSLLFNFVQLFWIKKLLHFPLCNLPMFHPFDWLHIKIKSGPFSHWNFLNLRYNLILWIVNKFAIFRVSIDCAILGNITMAVCYLICALHKIKGCNFEVQDFSFGQVVGKCALFILYHKTLRLLFNTLRPQFFADNQLFFSILNYVLGFLGVFLLYCCLSVIGRSLLALGKKPTLGESVFLIKSSAQTLDKQQFYSIKCERPFKYKSGQFNPKSD